MSLLSTIKGWFTTVWHSKAIDGARQFLATFDLSPERQDRIIKVVTDVKDAVDANKKPLSGEQKAQLAAQALTAIHQDYPWPDKVMEFLTTVVKIAWFVAKLTGKIA